MEYEVIGEPEIHDCVIKLRVNPQKLKDKVYIGCGAGFGGDRPLAALKLLQRVKELDYLVLECLAERTLSDRYQAMKSGGKGYDPHISEWLQLLLPLAIKRRVCIVTNMGANDPLGAQEEVIRVANRLGFNITVGLAYQSTVLGPGMNDHLQEVNREASVYLGAAPIVQCLERYKPDVVITSRVADAALFLGPMVYELGWNWDELQLLSQGSLAGHLLECGCQLTGGYYMHPGDKYRGLTLQDLLHLSLPYAEVSYDGTVHVAKVEGSRGILNSSTCAEQLLYEVGDPSSYITPDVIVDFQDVSFESVSNDKVLCTGARPSDSSVPDKLLLLEAKDCGWKGWGEISYGGDGCVQRAKAAEYLVRSWMEEIYQDANNHIISYIIGLDSLKATTGTDDVLPRATNDIRLRMDGLFEREEQAIQFTKEFTALYTNGPAGGGGISTGHKKEVILERQLVERSHVYWKVTASTNKQLKADSPHTFNGATKTSVTTEPVPQEIRTHEIHPSPAPVQAPTPAPADQKIALYNVAHSRAGDKGNDLNFSVIPHYPQDIERLKKIITPEWIKGAVTPLLDTTSWPDLDCVVKEDPCARGNIRVEIYEARGIHALNVVVRNILDGGVNCSRRIDRHGKTISDLILCQRVVLPPP
ncbi:hypothetical protein Leryth_019263 [Lithospermum erythrorhizon]|nr:hypothetical protein Leryth_019263 [Lithospermum erythrorhizon]